MGTKGTVLGLVVLAVVLGAGFALLSSPVDAQRVPDEAKHAFQCSRYRMTVLRVAVPAGATGEALDLADFAREIPGALVARSDAPGLKGQFAAVPSQKDLVHMLSKRGTSMEVIFAGETETTPGKRAVIYSRQRFPIRTVELRGNQRIVTTKFEVTAVKVELGRNALPGPRGDVHEMAVEVSSAAAYVGLDPVISELSTRGEFMLPDGYTAVLSFFDRIEGIVLMNTVDSLAEARDGPQDVPADVAAQYFVLITRMDLK